LISLDLCRQVSSQRRTEPPLLPLLPLLLLLLILNEDLLLPFLSVQVNDLLLDDLLLDDLLPEDDLISPDDDLIGPRF